MQMSQTGLGAEVIESSPVASNTLGPKIHQEKADKTRVKLVPTDCEIGCRAVSEATGSYVNVIFPKARGGENVALITLTADVLLLLCKPSTSAGVSALTADNNTRLGAGGQGVG